MSSSRRSSPRGPLISAPVLNQRHELLSLVLFAFIGSGYQHVARAFAPHSRWGHATRQGTTVVPSSVHLFPTFSTQRGHYSFHSDPQPLEARIHGHVGSPQERILYENALQRHGFRVISAQEPSSAKTSIADCWLYEFHPPSGMLRLLKRESTMEYPPQRDTAPKWVPIHTEQENVLVANGWSFLDGDSDDEPTIVPSFDRNGSGHNFQWNNTPSIINSDWKISSFGFNVARLSTEQVLQEAEYLHNDRSRHVLLYGDTDPPHDKLTHNGYDWNGNIMQQRYGEGIFACAIGGLPLFATIDLLPTTASDGWLSFARPISRDHVLHICPKPVALDQRTEVVCARSGCHLGHFFASDGNYCINTSALDYVAMEHHASDGRSASKFRGPISYQPWRENMRSSRWANNPSINILRTIISRYVPVETIMLGAGCCQHMEFALGQLPGIVQTNTGHLRCRVLSHEISIDTAGRVSQGTTGSGEVVRVDYDPVILPTSTLLDCFLAFTETQAPQESISGMGKSKNCIFVSTFELLEHARDSIQRWESQFDRTHFTRVEHIRGSVRDSFLPAENNQKDECRDSRRQQNEQVPTLSLSDWVDTYTQRSGLQNRIKSDYS